MDTGCRLRMGVASTRLLGRDDLATIVVPTVRADGVRPFHLLALAANGQGRTGQGQVSATGALGRFRCTFLWNRHNGGGL